MDIRDIRDKNDLLQPDTDVSEYQAKENQSDPVDWMESKAYMLDEMSQLVDLMTSEKQILTNQIVALKSELEGAKSQILELEESKFEADKEKKSLKSQLKELKRKEKEETVTLKVVLEATKRELNDTRLKLGMFSDDLEKAQTNSTKLTENNRSLEIKLTTVEAKNSQLTLSLSTKTKENAKLSSQLSSWREGYHTLRTDNTQLQSSLTTAQEKLRCSRDEVLTLRGRLANTKRAMEQLQIKCTSLECSVDCLSRQSPTIVKVPTRSRGENQLLEKCAQKDTLLASCMKDLSSANSKNQLLHSEMNDLQSQLSEEQKERMLLLSTLKTRELEWEGTCQEFKRKMDTLTEAITTKEKEGRVLTEMKRGVESGVREAEAKLNTTRQELQLIRKEIEKKEELWEKQKTKMEERNELLQRELSSCQEEVVILTEELRCARESHQTVVESLNGDWEYQINEIREDYRRIKDASTKRCTELAKEVWKLKSELVQQNIAY